MPTDTPDNRVLMGVTVGRAHVHQFFPAATVIEADQSVPWENLADTLDIHAVI